MDKIIEQYLKSIVINHHCKSCLKCLFKKYPNSLGCIYRHNNDHHLCPYAKKYYKDFGVE